MGYLRLWYLRQHRRRVTGQRGPIWLTDTVLSQSTAGLIIQAHPMAIQCFPQWHDTCKWLDSNLAAPSRLHPGVDNWWAARKRFSAAGCQRCIDNNLSVCNQKISLSPTVRGERCLQGQRWELSGKLKVSGACSLLMLFTSVSSCLQPKPRLTRMQRLSHFPVWKI